MTTRALITTLNLYRLDGNSASFTSGVPGSDPLVQYSVPTAAWIAMGRPTVVTIVAHPGTASEGNLATEPATPEDIAKAHQALGERVGLAARESGVSDLLGRGIHVSED